MSDTLLNVLKFFLVALIWLFFLRAMRAVWVEVRSTKERPEELQPDDALPGDLPSRPRLAPSVTGRKIPVLQLTVVSPPDLAGTTYELASEESVIGRAAGCAIPLASDTFVSHLHARIFTRGSEFWMEDLGSTNGSFVNSKKVASPVPLRSGDRIQIGRTVLEVDR